MQLIRYGRRTSRILGSTRLDPRSMLAFILAKCKLSEATVLHSCCSISSLVLGSGNVSLRHRLMAEQKLRGLLWKYLSLGDFQVKVEQHQQTTVQSSCISTIGHASAEKPHPEHSQIVLPRASNAPWGCWRSSFCIHLHAQSHGVPRTEMQ
jgi:hypothetical protein